MIRLPPRVIWFLLIPLSRLASAEPVFNTVTVNGRNYVNLADFVRFYQFDRKWRQNGPNLNLVSKYRHLQLRLNSRECFCNGIKLWLNDPPLESRSSILMPEVDIRRTLDPILRAWAVPRRPVRTIMIDPGHGGEDRGASSRNGTHEKNLTLDLANRVKRLLKEAHFRILMTRRSDDYVSLEDRAEMFNSSKADLFVSLHMNSAKPNPTPRGIETYCLTPAGLSSTGAIRRRWGIGRFDEEKGNRFDTQNMLLAYLVQQKAVSGISEAEDRGIKRARYLVLKNAGKPAVLIEAGFLSNSTEEKRLLDPKYRQKLAASIVEGLKLYAAIMNRQGFKQKVKRK
ncbi:MAG: N-acetylmuramoyl-L-alanine amidase [Verrucomicrobiae bacterium]|nr:N-acetylmuramoyl-L-alanine amidase [Verrucomicrobiae bacterium]